MSLCVLVTNLCPHGFLIMLLWVHINVVDMANIKNLASAYNTGYFTQV